MKHEDLQIKYWANMLNESFGNESGREIDERRMSGPAAARNGGVDEIADMRHKLDTGIVEFEFMKHSENGDVLRHAVGTTSESIIPTAERRRLDPNYDENVASYNRRSAFIIWFWDLEKNAARCFNTNRFERIINYQQTDQRIGNSIDHVGNIYIHRDVDAGMEDGNTVTDERAETVSNEMDQIETALDLADIAFAGGIDRGDFSGNDYPEFVISAGPDGEPTLKIIIRKHGSDNDQPYQLKINDLRREIRERWNVNVKRIEIDGLFEF